MYLCLAIAVVASTAAAAGSATVDPTLDTNPLQEAQDVLSGIVNSIAGDSGSGGLGGLAGAGILDSLLPGDGGLGDASSLAAIVADPIGVLTDLLGGSADDAPDIDLVNLLSAVSAADLANPLAFGDFLGQYVPASTQGLAYDVAVAEIYHLLIDELGIDGVLQIAALGEGLKGLGIDPVALLELFNQLANGDEGLDVTTLLQVLGLDPDGVQLDNLDTAALGLKAEGFMDADAKAVYDRLDWVSIRGDFDYDAIYKDGSLDLDQLVKALQTIGLDRIDPADLQTMVNGFDFTGFLLDTDLGKLTAVNYLLVYGLGTFQWSWLYAAASQLTLVGAIIDALPNSYEPYTQYIADFGIVSCFDTSNFASQGTADKLFEKLPHPIAGALCSGNSGSAANGDGPCSATIREIDHVVNQNSALYHTVQCIPEECYDVINFPCMVAGLPTSSDLVVADIRKVFASYLTCDAHSAGSIGGAKNGNALKLITQGALDSIMGAKYVAAKALPGIALQDMSVVWQAFTEYCAVDGGKGPVYAPNDAYLRQSLVTYFDGVTQDDSALTASAAGRLLPVMGAVTGLLLGLAVH